MARRGQSTSSGNSLYVVTLFSDVGVAQSDRGRETDVGGSDLSLGIELVMSTRAVESQASELDRNHQLPRFGEWNSFTKLLFTLL